MSKWTMNSRWTLRCPHCPTSWYPCPVSPSRWVRGAVIGSNQGKVLPACGADAHREESLSQAGKPRGKGPGNSPQLTGSRNLDTSVRPQGRSGVLGCLPRRHLTPREQHVRPEAEDPPSGAHTPGLSERRHESGLFKVAKFSAILLCSNK